MPSNEKQSKAIFDSEEDNKNKAQVVFDELSEWRTKTRSNSIENNTVKVSTKI